MTAAPILVYRVEDANRMGPFHRVDGNARRISVDYLNTQTGEFGIDGVASPFALGYARDHERALPLSFTKSMGKEMRIGCSSLEQLRRFFPFHHIDLRGFAVTVYEVAPEHCVQAPAEIAFNIHEAKPVRSVSLADFFAPVTPEMARAMDGRAREFIWNTNGVFLRYWKHAIAVGLVVER